LPLLWPEEASGEAEESKKKNKSKRSKATKWKLRAMLPQLVRL
jgi:hypothetical protein